ncbi:uncharacterized protein LOC130736620 [Lotus japonicus]|uniref:uncharacterized protein LOC130736620 n=1 Tax=Lotus japonicus TaxID=34305 RepID=UPI00258D836F|nr:uncharacterized protein LOC130736620 [Lotus japonicus]
MASVFNDLANIDSSKVSWKILVKVVRLWSTRRFNGCKIPHAIELVLMVSKEGGVYSMSFLAPVVNSDDYKTTKYQYKVNFLYNTEVHPMNQNPINFSPFLFVHVRSILNHAIDVNYLVDVLGILTGVGNEKSYGSDRDSIKMNVIEKCSVLCLTRGMVPRQQKMKSYKMSSLELEEKIGRFDIVVVTVWCSLADLISFNAVAETTGV